MHRRRESEPLGALDECCRSAGSGQGALVSTRDPVPAIGAPRSMDTGLKERHIRSVSPGLDFRAFLLESLSHLSNFLSVGQARIFRAHTQNDFLEQSIPVLGIHD